MANIIPVSIDVRKLDKTRFKEGKADKNGHIPLYCDLVLIPRREVGQYGDTHLVKQSKKKEETVEMPIIGNAKEKDAAPSAKPSRPETTTTTTMNDPDQDVPF